MVSLSLLDFVLQDYGSTHPLVMDALAEMSEAQIQMRLTHPPVRAQARSQGRGGVRAGLPKYLIPEEYFSNQAVELPFLPFHHF